MQLYILGIFSFYFFKIHLTPSCIRFIMRIKGGYKIEVCVNGVRDWCCCRNSGIRHI